MAVPLREVAAPSGPDVDAKFADAVADRFNVAKKSALQSFNPSDHYTANRSVCQLVEPGGELGERPDAVHGLNVIDRIQCVNPSGRQLRAQASLQSQRTSSRFRCPNPAGGEHPLLAGSSQRQAQTRRRQPVVQLLAEATTGRTGRPTGCGRHRESGGVWSTTGPVALLS